MWAQYLNDLEHVLGLDDPGGAWYLWHSGLGSTLNPVWMFGMIYMYRKNMCHVHRCISIAKVQTDAGDHVCRRHHPNKAVRPTVQDIHDAHNAAQ